MSKPAIQVTHVRQTTMFPAVACVACMVTGTTPEQFFEYCGHDGSENGFQLRELIHYLVDHDWMPGAVFDIGSEHAQQFITQRAVAAIKAALVVVRDPQNMKCTHLLLWDGKQLWDPQKAPPTGGRPLQFRDYQVRQVWPLTNINGNDFPRGHT